VHPLADHPNSVGAVGHLVYRQDLLVFISERRPNSNRNNVNVLYLYRLDSWQCQGRVLAM